MNKAYLYIGIAFLVVGISGATATYASEGNGIKSFVEFLIAKNIIPESRAPQARNFAEKFDRVAKPGQSASSTKPIEVKVSQLLEFSQRTFKEGEEVQGLLFLVTNPDDTARQFEARRRCQVSYRIYDSSEALLFDSASSTPACQGTERVTYLMQPHQTRMFEVRHSDSAYHLEPGTYRFELNYPEYGKGDLEVTITAK